MTVVVLIAEDEGPVPELVVSWMLVEGDVDEEEAVLEDRGMLVVLEDVVLSVDVEGLLLLLLLVVLDVTGVRLFEDVS